MNWKTRDQIMDPRRLVRPRAHERRIAWRVDLKTRMKFRDLLMELVDLECDPPSYERERRMESLRDDIRSLPGYPRSYDPERDVIVPVTTSSMR